MVHYFDSILSEHKEWVMKQTVFFSASAPRKGKHINVSPKGLPNTSFSILNPNLCAYVDATGSGIETVANIYENGRCTIMFCSFGPSPRIMRFFCTGRVIEHNDPSFKDWLERMGEKSITGMRATIILDVFKVQISCGYAVPYLTMKEDPEDNSKEIPYLEDRQTLGHWAGKQISQNAMDDYRARMNARSLDGLPGLKISRQQAGERIWLGDIQARVSRFGPTPQILSVALVSALLTVLSMYMLRLTNLPTPLFDLKM